MSKNKTKQVRISIPIFITSLVGVCIISISVSYVIFQRVNQSNSSSALVKVEALYNELITSYIGEVKSDDLVEGALAGMTNAIADPYTTYLGITDNESLENTISGSFEGIGAILSLIEGVPTIAEEPVKDTPAEKAGLKVSDIILAVDGDSTEGLSLAEVVAKVRGEKDTDVTLTIQRESETLDVVVTRDIIAIESVYYNIDEDNDEIGYIQVVSFSETTFEELQQAIKDLRVDGAKSFIIDVRSNPGGVLSQVEQMSSMFLEDGKTIVKFEDADGNITEDVADSSLDDGMKVTEPVVVLIDENSASASEIFAAALNESAGVTLIGTQSYGKGTVQTVKQFTDGSAIKLTIAKWLTPNGTWINEEGVKPTIEADYPDYANLITIDRSQEYSEGDVGAAVENIQQMLIALGYQIEATQIYDQAVIEAVQEFQNNQDIEVTGVVNNETAAALESSLRTMISENDNAYKQAIEELK